MYLINTLVAKDECNELIEVFESMDVNNDGVLSKKEILNGFEKSGKIITKEERRVINAGEPTAKCLMAGAAWGSHVRMRTSTGGVVKNAVRSTVFNVLSMTFDSCTIHRLGTSASLRSTLVDRDLSPWRQRAITE